MKFLNILFLFTLLGLTLAIQLESIKSDYDPDIGLTILDYVPKYGYPIENHTVQTDDGYILTMHRIPHGRKENASEGRPVVLIMHGLLSSSMDFVNMGPEKGIGFLLADAGFDVWLGNQRGNTWSRQHTSLDPNENKTEFWNFSFHEIGVYDLAAKIDYILEKTGQEKLSYIGHSQGTTAFFALMATKPEYNDKIKIMDALAPIAMMTHLPGAFVRFLADNYDLLNILAETLNIHEILPHSDLFTEIGVVICGNGSEYRELCADLLFMLGGYDPDELDRDFIPIIASNCPAGASVKQIFHYLQEILSGFFRQFDYGILGNIAIYGQSSPPVYNISLITAPIVLHGGENDLMAAPEDVEAFAEQLPNLLERKSVPLKEFGHLDFLWAIDIVELLNNDVVDIMKKYK